MIRTQVKIFTQMNAPSKLEDDINDWLVDAPGKIIDIEVSQSGRMDEHTVVIIQYEKEVEL